MSQLGFCWNGATGQHGGAAGRPRTPTLAQFNRIGAVSCNVWVGRLIGKCSHGRREGGELFGTDDTTLPAQGSDVFFTACASTWNNTTPPLSLRHTHLTVDSCSEGRGGFLFFILAAYSYWTKTFLARSRGNGIFISYLRSFGSAKTGLDWTGFGNGGGHLVNNMLSTVLPETIPATSPLGSIETNHDSNFLSRRFSMQTYWAGPDTIGTAATSTNLDAFLATNVSFLPSYPTFSGR